MPTRFGGDVVSAPGRRNEVSDGSHPSPQGTRVGVPEDHAVATGLAFHTLYLVGVGLLGAIGHGWLAGHREERAAPPE